MKKIPLYKCNLDLYYEKLKNGLEVYIIPNKKVNNIYANYVTKYGSRDNSFIPHGEDKVIEVPKGIAHFLEHKLFDQEDGSDVFSFFNERGASLNAYTNAFCTSYYFCGTEAFEENLEKLQEFVETPYFTDESVKKEKGIIIQEIGMYKDNPGRVLYENLTAITVKVDPVRDSTIGSVESIKSITKDDLYKCYNTFYHPSNMFISISGNVDPEKTMDLIKKHQNKRKLKAMDDIEKTTYDEPDEVGKKHSEKTMNIVTPKFAISYKINVKELLKQFENVEIIAYLGIAKNIKISSTSLLYERLVEEGMLNYTLSSSVSVIGNHAYISISGTSDYPKEVLEEIKKEFESFNITEEEVKRRSKVLSSTMIKGSDDIFGINDFLIEEITETEKVRPNAVEIVENLSLDSLNKVLAGSNFSNFSTYIIYPENN